MADEASETVAGGIRNYLGALGFILPLLGGEELIRLHLTGSGLPWPISAALIFSGLPIYLSPAIWRWLTNSRGAAADAVLTYLSNEDSELGYAVMMMAWQSAWGKWFAAERLASNPNGTPDHREDELMRTASRQVWQALIDGKLEARGRKPGQMDFEVLPSTHWRSSPLHMIRDNATLWRLILIPTGGVEFSTDGTVTAHDPVSKERTDKLAAYDSILIRARQFESLWPRKRKDIDAARKHLLKKAKKAGVDQSEIERLSQD